MADNLTIDDIAEALGVSKTTVSRAISGKGRISQATTERILTYINEHNYKPNVYAQGLAMQKTSNIGVVWPGDSDAGDLPFFQKCLLGINRAAAQSHYDLLVSILEGSDISGIRHANIRPHIGVRRGDPCRVAKSAADEPGRLGRVLFFFQQMHQGRRRYMGHMADHRRNPVMIAIIQNRCHCAGRLDQSAQLQQ